MDTTELDKMRAARSESQLIGEFIAWLDEKGMAIAAPCSCGFLGCAEHGLVRVSKSIEQLLADYFEIDLKKIEEERCAILEELQWRNETARALGAR